MSAWPLALTALPTEWPGSGRVAVEGRPHGRQLVGVVVAPGRALRGEPQRAAAVALVELDEALVLSCWMVGYTEPGLGFHAPPLRSVICWITW